MKPKKIPGILGTMRSIAALFALVVLTACGQHKAPNTDTEEWVDLLSLENQKHWVPKIKGYALGDNFGNTFQFEDALLVVQYQNYSAFENRFGHIFYDSLMSSYHLKFTYRFTDDHLKDTPDWAFRNSGVMFHGQSPESMLIDQDFPISVEYQLLGEAEAGVPRPTANMCSPGTEVFIDGEMAASHCVSSTSATYAYNSWVTAELIVHEDGHIIHVVEGDTVMRYEKPVIGGGVVNGFDPAVKDDGRELNSGFISFQAEGHGIQFKHIMIRSIDKK